MILMEVMQRELGISKARITDIANRARHMYKIYSIPKRNGNGQRIIAHPAAELKVLQRWLAVRIFAQLPVHECVFSYKVGISIGQHAELHRSKNYLLRIDLKDFFPSITPADVVALLRVNRDRVSPALAMDDMQLAARLACRGNVMTIGAPTSPSLSNAVLFAFDTEWHQRALQMGVTYTRYADDLYFSTDVPNVLQAINAGVRASVAAMQWPKIRINDSKTTFTSRKRRRVVTGITLTSDRHVSLGRDNKRTIRSLVHRFRIGSATEKQLSFLKGYLSFAASVEPRFVESLARKFGPNVLANIRRIPHIARKVVALKVR